MYVIFVLKLCYHQKSLLFYSLVVTIFANFVSIKMDKLDKENINLNFQNALNATKKLIIMHQIGI